MRTALAERDDPLPVLARTSPSRGSSPDRPRRWSSCSPAGPTCRSRRGGPTPWPVTRAGRPCSSNAETWARLGLLVLRGEREYAAARHPRGARGGVADPRPAGRPPRWSGRRRTGPAARALTGSAHGRPVLLGGFHGRGRPGRRSPARGVSVTGCAGWVPPLGAGVCCAPDGECPLELTSRVVDYLAGQSAGRCGPCFNGLPALARRAGLGARRARRAGRVEELSNLVERRGACAHPDGTVRLVRSLLGTFAGRSRRTARRCLEATAARVVP